MMLYTKQCISQGLQVAAELQLRPLQVEWVENSMVPHSNFLRRSAATLKGVLIAYTNGSQYDKSNCIAIEA